MEIKNLDIIVTTSKHVYVAILIDGKFNIVNKRSGNVDDWENFSISNEIESVYRAKCFHSDNSLFVFSAYHNIIKSGFDVDYKDKDNFEKVWDVSWEKDQDQFNVGEIVMYYGDDYYRKIGRVIKDDKLSDGEYIYWVDISNLSDPDIEIIHIVEGNKLVKLPEEKQKEIEHMLNCGVSSIDCLDENIWEKFYEDEEGECCGYCKKVR